MKYFWSKDKCGDPAIVITDSDLARIIERECDKFIFENYEETLRHFAKIKDNEKYFRKFAFSILAGNICDEARKIELGCPFEHVKDEDLEKIFLKEKYENSVHDPGSREL